MHQQRQGYNCYLPTLRQQKIQRAQLKVVSEPMFPRYVFVAGDSHFQTKGASVIRSTIGVHEMVHFGNKPAVIQFGLLKQSTKRLLSGKGTSNTTPHQLAYKALQT